MEATVFQNYVLDLGTLITQMAIDAKSTKLQSPNPYQLGRLMAFHEIVSLMQSQAQVFGIPLSAIGLADINPEKDLL